MKPLFINLLVLISLLFSACQFGQTARRVKKDEVQCAESRLKTSFDYHNKAKKLFRSYYKTRKESELFFAWYASEDSIYMAKAVSRCFDKKNKHYHAVKNLRYQNRNLQSLVLQNMRHHSQVKLSELYLDEYRQIFVRDIQ